MILLTVGTQLPFDRLVEAVDAIAPKVKEEIVGQIGRSSYKPVHIDAREHLSPAEFDKLVCSARAIISHAGIGSIITAQRYSKPIIIMPRLARYGEHRNNHQIATCQQLSKYSGIYIANSREDLENILKNGVVFTSESAEEYEKRRIEFCNNLKKYFE